MPPTEYAERISSLPWRVQFEGHTVGAFPSVKEAARFVSDAWHDDLTGIVITFVVEVI